MERYNFLKNFFLPLNRHHHHIYFSQYDRENKCRSKSLELASRAFREIGDRRQAAVLAQKAIDLGNENPNLLGIIKEQKMSSLRFYLRRIGRKIY